MSTRVLLQCAVFAAIQVILYFSLTPITGALAAVFPPGYAVVAGVYSVMIFAARLFTGQRGTATLTALLTGLLIVAVSPIGFLVMVPFVVAGVVFDIAIVVFESSGTRRRSIGTVLQVLLAAAVSAVALFAVSLAVFSAEHLTAGVLTATLLGRLLGQLGAACCAIALVRLLSRAGVRGTRTSILRK